jgi:flagellar hook protein FlgE
MAMRALYIGISGMQAQQNSLSTIANNIANDQTVGYKMQEAVFEELFYQQYRSPVAPNEKYAGNNPMDVGNGVKIGAINTVHSQGNVTYTGNATDMAIQGDGFFVLGDQTGANRLYTRSGNFITSKNNELISKSGQYVMGWNVDPLTNKINTSSVLKPVTIDLGSISKPYESSQMSLVGNLDIDAQVGDVYGLQVPSWDRLGTRHEINFDFIKTSGNTYNYVAVPVDQFRPSASVANAVMITSDALVTHPQFMRGDYQIQTAPGAGGTVDITLVDPLGANVLTQNISDVNQNVNLVDGTGNQWFTVEYVSGGTPSTATFTVGETGQMTFNSNGQVTAVTGNGPSSEPEIVYTPAATGLPVSIDVDLKRFSGLSADTSVKMEQTDGSGAATLINYTITDGGNIDGYYSDGMVKQIARVAMATFSNPSGLSRVGQGNFLPTPNSGVADIGLPNSGSRGQIKAQATETSNVDLAKQFTDMLTSQKSFQANTKVIRTTDTILTSLIQLIN